MLSASQTNSTLLLMSFIFQPIASNHIIYNEKFNRNEITREQHTDRRKEKKRIENDDGSIPHLRRKIYIGHVYELARIRRNNSLRRDIGCSCLKTLRVDYTHIHMR